jgi:very-short-patch-repair endonuclease
VLRMTEGQGDRRRAVDQARRQWIDQLIDRSRNNRLLFFQPRKARTVELTEKQIELALPLMAGAPVPVNRLFGRHEQVHGDEELELFAQIEEVEELDVGVARRLQEIQKHGDEDYEERGLETVYFAYGMATWRLPDGAAPPSAAVILVPIKIDGKVGRMTLRPHGDPEINLAMTHMLEREHGCAGLVNRLDSLLVEIDELAPADRAQRIFDELRSAVAGVAGFQISRRAVIDNLAFAKLAMVRDLERWGDRIADHDIVAAIAGDPGARLSFQSVQSAGADVDKRALDRRPPAHEYLALDADSSQISAIAAVARGHSGVIIGPPGTGKSQTIANLICELIANGRRVLFVAEKRAALDVVKERLARNGLDDLVLDLHGAVSRKQIAAQFAEALGTVRQILPPEAEDLHRDFAAHRARLNQYVERLHLPREPSRYSAYELIGRVLALEADGADGTTRWRASELSRLTREQVASIDEVLVRAAGQAGLLVRDSPSPWTNAELHDQEAADTAVEQVVELQLRDLPDLEHQTRRCVARLQVEAPKTLAEHGALLAAVNEINHLLSHYPDAIFQLDLAGLATALAPARGKLTSAWAALTDGGYRAARRRLLGLRRGRVRSARLLDEAARAQRLMTIWRDFAPADFAPQPYEDFADLEAAHAAVVGRLRTLRRFLGLPPDSTLIVELKDLLTWLASDRQTANRIPHVRAFEREIDALGAGAYLRELQSRRVPADRWIPNLRFAWLSSCLDEMVRMDPDLAVFDGAQHDRVVREFQLLDKRRLAIAVDRVKRAFGERAVDAQNRFPDQALLLRRQAELRSRHLPFRELVRLAPDVVTALKPCWMASPLAVSQLLSGPEEYFDVVIFDEASQVRPVDAVTSLLRARTAVVAGDTEQLPPTSFFAAERESEDDVSHAEEGLGDFESILRVMRSFLPEWPLDWHYRSHDDRLIAFSNHNIYKDRLVTFPSGGGSEPPLTHVQVTQTRAGDSEEQSSTSEVGRVVELVLDHAASNPEMTLGVIALGSPHARRIDLALARARRTRPELDGFFGGHPNERFFVKNLERVQGDERDVIILSIGYGKDASGRLLYRFGPLLREHGYRRLNVAVTRAKHRMVLVSSFGHEDMDPSRSPSRGAELLRRYLEYAASGGHVFSDIGPTGAEPDEFEAQVQAALERAGLSVIPQFGASKYRIDLAVQHPEKPGRCVLAVECDGAPYHSSPMARDRDRLRQEHLERRGWRFVRVWSTAWYTNRTAETKRVIDAYQSQLVADSGEERAAVVPTRQAGGVGNSPTAARPPWPRVTRGLPITEYSERELDRVARWIRSDGLLRTDEDILAEMIQALGFQKRGSRIVPALRAAIERTRMPHVM